MRTLWFKLLMFFLGLALFENIAFPLAANHGRFDLQNKSMQPYLFLSALAFIAIVLVWFIIYQKPLPKTALYTLAKFAIPLVAIFLIVNITDLVPMYWTFSSLLIFTLHVFGVIISLGISVGLILNKTLTK